MPLARRARLVLLATLHVGASATASPKADGYRGIWYGLKEYGGGYAFFPSQHSPYAIYCAKANKTFFVYGGAVAGKLQLQAMASYYDHQRDGVPRPTIVHDWGDYVQGSRAADAHRNPTIALDGDGYVWVFVSGHGDTGYVYRANAPYSVEHFEQVIATPMTYPNPWWLPGKGFFVFFTKYERSRESFWTTAADGQALGKPETWQSPGQLSAWTVGRDGDRPGHGLYQYTAARGSRVATVINNWIGRTRDRSNLFYLQSDDLGKTWQTADGKEFSLPIREVHCAALVRDFWSEGLQVYVQHLTFDLKGRPAILFLNSPAGQTNEGPARPRIWRVAHWDGACWQFHPVTTSLHNFDCGSLYIEQDGTWRIIGPTEPGPQPWRSGGEVVMWVSHDEGRHWEKLKQLTRNSPHNHCYVRCPVNAHPDFYAVWADGHGYDKTAPCRLYFCTKEGTVRVLPPAMDGAFARPMTLQ